ncbi:hypothetical protein [Vibrio aestuarianus]|uniref:hypothetical protein n=1 Tax=Vibrio aestuarianus TaxID=28171 RepID=UPI00237CB9D2|nr:hypothetical protein [Vibrio aestuarianus]MDE1211614.1 hypothetical protein [Vibrio aestuarianus]MDE1319070.1 hypothetical protein [Vibrio aestuarianus]
MTVQPVVSSSSTTQPSSGEPALQARDSILGPTPPPMPLGSESGLPDSTCPGESLLESNSSDSQVRKDVHSAKKPNRTGGTHKNHRRSNKVSNKTKAKIQLASVIGATTLGAILAPFTGGLSLLPTAFIVLFGNASALAVYGGSEIPIGNNGPKKEEPKNEDESTSAPAPAPVGSDVPAPDPIPANEENEEEAASSTHEPLRHRKYTGNSSRVIDNSVNNSGNSSSTSIVINYSSDAHREGTTVSESTQTDFPSLDKIIQTSGAAGVKVETKELTEEELREVLEKKGSDKDTVNKLVANHRANGSSVIKVQVNDPTSDISTAIISVPNEYLPHDAPSAASQTRIPQAAQPDASGGWIRDENGWRELKETPRVSRLSPQNSVSAAGISKPVTSFTNSLLSNQSAQSQVAQPGASGGWIRDKNGWIERNETPRVFATQGSASARDAMWRNHSALVAAGSQNTLPGSLLKSGVDTPIVTTQDATSSRNTSNTISHRSVNDSKLSTGASRLSRQNSVSAAGIPQPVTSLTNTPSSNNAQLEQSVEKHYEVHIPAPILTTEGTISGRSLNYSRGLFKNVKDIEEIRKQIRHQLSLEDYRTLAALPIAGGGNRNNLVAAPVNMQNLVKESSV